MQNYNNKIVLAHCNNNHIIIAQLQYIISAIIKTLARNKMKKERYLVFYVRRSKKGIAQCTQETTLRLSIEQYTAL